jgi:hypothetical protein
MAGDMASPTAASKIKYPTYFLMRAPSSECHYGNVSLASFTRIRLNRNSLSLPM